MVLLPVLLDTREYSQFCPPRKRVHEPQFAVPDEATLYLPSSLLLFEAYAQGGLQSSDSIHRQGLLIHLQVLVCLRSLTIVFLSQPLALMEVLVMLLTGF